MASNNIKYKILSLVAMAFLSVGFSYASVEDDSGYTKLDKISINTYCKIAKLPLFWFDTGKCAKVEPIFDLGISKSVTGLKAFSGGNNPANTTLNFESISEIKTKKEILSTIESQKITELRKVNSIMPMTGVKEDSDVETLFATSTLLSGNGGTGLTGQAMENMKNIIGVNSSWSIDHRGRIVAKEILIKKLCLEDLCIDKKTLQRILNSSTIASTTPKSI